MTHLESTTLHSTTPHDDRSALDGTLRHLASVLDAPVIDAPVDASVDASFDAPVDLRTAATGRTPAADGPVDARGSDPDDAAIAACRLVAQSLGVTLDRLPVGGGDDGSGVELAELCEINHLRHRRVRLTGTWWRQDAGPILASRAGRSVALLPHRGGYQLVDPVTGTRHELDERLAAELDDHGRVLYRPLPDRALDWTDLVRAGWRDAGRDFATLVAASVASGLLALAVPVATSHLVDGAVVPGDRTALVHMVLALIVAAVAGGLFQVVRGLTLLRLQSRIDGTLQAAIWDRLLALPVGFYRRFTVGDMGDRAMGLDSIRNLLTGDVTSALLSSIAALASWAILFHYSWSMALVATGLAAVLVAVVIVVASLQLRHQRCLRRESGKLSSLMYALLGGLEKLRVGQAEVRAFAAWGHRFAVQRRHALADRRLANRQAVFTAAFGVVGSLALFAMVVATGGADMSVGRFLAFHAAHGQFQAAVFGVVSIVPTILGFVPTYERIRPILQTVPESAPVAGRDCRDPGRLEGRLAFEHVSFRYDDDDAQGPLVLDDVSMTIEPGEFVALVGPSGSGKTTCLRLLLGFDQPTAGVVTIDGHDLADLDRHLVRRQFGTVLQDHRAMAGNIFHNIVGSRPLTMDDAWDAARRVGLEREIEALPMGMFTSVNQRGVAFSGGQRQRMLLARAIVHGPRVLLLDEATSALDNRTQDLVIRSLESLRVTRLVIAHRLSTVRGADRILVLDRGRLVEEGTYAELCRARGLFHRMAERQQIRAA